MKTIIVLWTLCLALPNISGYCRMGIVETGDHCSTKEGIVLHINETYTDTTKCERCICSQHSPGHLILHCCGYGIHAGAFGAPPGCKVVADTDGCSVKMVKVDDENQLC